MTSPSQDTDTVSTQGWANLTAAAQQLRQRRDPRAVQVAQQVLEQALRSSRRSLPIRAYVPLDYVHVSDQVLIARLRQVIDEASQTCAVGRVAVRVTPDQILEELTVELYVQYGEVLMDAADSVRLLVDEVVAELLGRPAQPVRLVVTHVHVSDITRGSPHLVEPDEE